MTFSTKLVDTGDKTITEDQAIHRLKHGDLTGMEVIVQRYQVKAVHAAILILHDRTLAEEIVQNTFFHTAEKIHQFDSRRPFGPWFMRSVINAALHEVTNHKRMVSLNEGDGDEIGKIAEWLIDPGLCPEDLIENEALYKAVWKALDQLSPNQRAAIVMRYFQEKSETEITKSFHRPLTTIKWWLHAAREKLRLILQKDYLATPNDQEIDDE